VLGLGSYQTAWAWLHKLRRAMVRPGRDALSGWIEVDETYVGGWEEGMKGRRRGEKSLVVIAAQVVGNGIGRIRMRVIPDASADSLHPFIEASAELGSYDPHRWLAGLCEHRQEGLSPRNFAHTRSPSGSQ
jgi:ISXO2-like transposase domain